MPGSLSDDRLIDVLLVEDDPSSIDAMTQLLAHCGCTVRHAATVLDAMPLLRQAPAVAVLDLMLPDGSGARVLEIIRTRHLKTKVAITTACRDRERLAAVVKQKPELILTKPIDFIRLLSFITDVRNAMGPGSGQPGSTTVDVTAPAAA